MEPKERMAHAVKSTFQTLGKEVTGGGGEQPTPTVTDEPTVRAIIETWASTPRKVAEQIITRYGLPNEAVPSRLIWFNNGPWKRTIVYRDEVPHNFPKPHTDVLEQFVDYRVPPRKFGDIAEYDGSVVIERTKGEVSARCDMEEMNYLALNLMHEIVTGRRTVEQARREYAATASGFMMGRPSPYVEGLQFDARAEGTPDLDTPLLGPMFDEAVEKAKDVAR